MKQLHIWVKVNCMIYLSIRQIQRLGFHNFYTTKLLQVHGSKIVGMAVPSSTFS